MKKILFYGTLLAVIFIFLIGCNRNDNDKNSEKNLQMLYMRQNAAFGLSQDNHDARNVYHGSDELNQQMLAVSLYAYSLSGAKDNVTVQNVVDYLSSEYAEDGTLMIYSCPDSINNYIIWWYCDGSNEALQFYTEVVVYLSKNGQDYHIENYSVEELQEILPLVREEK